MQNKTTDLRYAAGALLIVVPTLFTIAFSLLAARFHYPAILRQPAGEILFAFHKGASGLLPLWWMMLAAALLFLPTTVLVAQWLVPSGINRSLAMVFGVTAAIVQAVGISRWIFAVPTLAKTYAGFPTDSPEAITSKATFEVLHLLLGQGIGEWFGYLFTALWTGVVALSIWRRGGRRQALLGLILAVGIAIGMLEPFGVRLAGQINAVAYTIWSLWLIVLGFQLIQTTNQSGQAAPTKTTKENLMNTYNPFPLLIAVACLAIGGAARAEETPIVPEPTSRVVAPVALSEAQSRPSSRLYVHLFRSPSTGLEYRNANIGIHAGLYTTIVGGAGKSTEFLKTGITGYYAMGKNRRLEGYLSAAYVRGFNREYKNRDGLFLEHGTAWFLGKGFELRTGAGVLLANGNRPKFNPTIGLSWSMGL